MIAHNSPKMQWVNSKESVTEAVFLDTDLNLTHHACSALLNQNRIGKSKQNKKSIAQMKEQARHLEFKQLVICSGVGTSVT